MSFVWSNTLKSSDAVITNNGKTVSIKGGWAVSQEDMTSGRHYFEFIINTYSQIVIGISQSITTATKPLDNQIRAMYGYDGNKIHPRSAYGTSYNATNTIGIAVDMDKGEISFTRDGVDLGVAFNNLKELNQIKLYMSTSTSGGSETLTIVDDIRAMKYPNVAKKFLYNNRLILQNSATNKNYSLLDNTLIHLPNASNKNMILHGMEQGKEIQLDAPFTKHRYVVDNQDGTQTITDEEVEPFSMYDYIGETPSILVYTESTEDIIVSTNTEPFDVYDEFDESVEVLYYTSDVTVTDADIIFEANWSPIDELDGNLEVATWTDEVGGARKLEMSATPKPQFTYSQDLIPLEEFIKSVQVRDLSIYKDDSMVRILMSNNNSDWYTWNGMDFIKIINITDSSIIADGMTVDKFNGLTPQNLTKWSFNAVNIGVFLYDDIRDEVRSKVAKVSVDTQIPSNTSEVEDVNLYILNTTAKINIDLSGLSLTGQVTDDDMTRVQYRVKLNGEPYYPADGSFTVLSNPPLNIDLTIKSSEIKIGDWNTIEVEFQDYFGSSDTWSAQFIGKYAGIMFSDPDGNYYSSDVGQVLKYLDFGEILTGQVTEYYEVKLKNEYGFDVRDATLTVNTQNFPRGLKVELSSTNSGVGSEEIAVGSLAVDDEFTFYVRMRSSADTVPNSNSKFDIVVLAIRDI